MSGKVILIELLTGAPYKARPTGAYIMGTLQGIVSKGMGEGNIW